MERLPISRSPEIAVAELLRQMGKRFATDLTDN